MRLKLKRWQILIVAGALAIAAGLALLLWDPGDEALIMPPPPPANWWRGFTYDGGYALEIDAPTALCDTPIKIRVTGLTPQQPVVLRARMSGSTGRQWEAFAAFEADGAGIVDVSNAKPVYGTYHRADGMGLFWSMLPVGQSDAAAAASGQLDPMVVTLTVESGDKPLASAQVSRLLIDEAGVVRQPANQDGRVATLFYPAAPGRYPAVIVLPGSEGGLREGLAALLASHGYTTLALAYFGVDPLPRELVEIPLEYFAGAMAWLKTQPAVDPERIAVMGGSKGGELALLLGATFPQDVKAVVAYAPSGIVYQGLYTNPQSYSQGPRSSWSLEGKPIPFVSGALTPDFVGFLIGQPVAFRASYQAPLDAQAPAAVAAVAAATIPVEKINGPVLLISGADDQMWPSSRLADMVIARLQAHNHPFADAHLKYEAAGHAISVPCFPAAGALMGPFVVGGSIEANALASADAWPQVLSFLARWRE